MESASATSDPSAAENTDTHDVNSTVAGTSMKSERDTNESTRASSGDEVSSSLTDPYHDPAGNQSQDTANALDGRHAGIAHLLEEEHTTQNLSNISRDDTTRQPGEAEISSSELIEEIRILREKVSKIEEQANPRPSYPILEAEWRTARESSDTNEEMRLWKWFLEQMKDLAEDSNSATPYQGRTYTLDLNRLAREMCEDPVYESDVLRWRKSWERKLPPLRLMPSGYERDDRITEVNVSRFRDSDEQAYDKGGFEDSDSDGSLDFEYNLTILRQRYLQKVDRLHEERDVMLQQKRVKKRQRAQELEALQNEKRSAKEELQAARNANEEPEDQAKKEVAVPAENSSGPFSTSAQDTMERATNETPPSSYAFPKLNRVDWIGFKALRNACEETSFAIDVLVGEPVIRLGYPNRPKRSKKAKWADDKDQISQEVTTTTKQPAALTGQPPLPERIRIHSKQLIRILEKIHGEGVDSTGSLVIIRPFRVLMYYNQALRDWCQKLEKKFSVAETSKSSPTGETTTIQPANSEDLTKEEVSIDERTVEEDAEKPEKDSEKPEKDSETPEEDAEKPEEDAEKPEDDDPDDDSTSQAALHHLRCLLEFMDTDIANKLTYLRDTGTRKILFSDIWHLFKPGDEVIASDGKQVYRVINITSAAHRVASYGWAYWIQPSVDEDTPIVVDCVYVDFDGKRLGPIGKQFIINRFDNERTVTSLEVYPLRFHSPRRGQLTDDGDGDENFRRQLIVRGRKFADIAAATHKHMYYAGQALETREDIESQVVVDFELALSAEENKDKDWTPMIEERINIESQEEKKKEPCRAECCRNENVHDDSFVETKRSEEYVASLFPDSRERLPSVAIFPRSAQDTKSPENRLSEEDLIIMSYRVFAFVLRTRKWEKLDLTHLTDVKRSDRGGEGTAHEKEGKTAFDRLVLPKDHKEMVESLISQHFRDKESSQSKTDQFDIVRGKGKGLILLLHGAPGVGKTSTAEGVAELFKKPLFQITCGDLGTTAAEVEKALETNFALANRWGSILLLDEADVFLSARNPKDFVRNGLVAVFLRVLEYYAGILFLTTNRIGDFDEAFASRIHISLYYPPLDQESTKKVFELNLEMIEERMRIKNREIEIKKEKIIAFAGDYWIDHENARWNGRQIRNACQTALALAEFEAHGGSAMNPNAIVKLKPKHIIKVAESYLEFTQYLIDLYGTNDSRRAMESGLRRHDHIFDGQRSRPQHFQDLALKFATTRRQHAPEESHRPGGYRMSSHHSDSPENRPKAPKPRRYSPAGAPAPNDSSSEEGLQGDHPHRRVLYSRGTAAMRDPLDHDDGYRWSQQRGYGASHSASRPGSRYEPSEDEGPPGMAHESFYEGQTPSKKPRSSRLFRGEE